MERAAELLRIRGLTVRDVAHRVGYRQPAQFAKAFRRHHGVAPSDYRAAERRFVRSSATAPAGGVTGPPTACPSGSLGSRAVKPGKRTVAEMVVVGVLAAAIL